MNQDKIYRRCLPAEKRIKEKYFWCPLLLTGTLVKCARQVGKTHLIRRVLKEEGCDVFEVNLIETPEAVSILQQAGTVDELMIGLSALGGQRLQKGKTVIFIDEIQKYKEMVTKIKFLVDDGSFRYVLSGSLQGVELTNIESAPIGYLSSIEMFPLDFEEFLQITDISDEVIDSLRRSFETRSAVLDAVNDKMLNLFRRYLVVGGMPEAVSVFADTKNVKDVITTHQDIKVLYKLDFTQYESDDKKLMISSAYGLIPSELLKQNRRFIVTDLKNGLHFDRVESTFLWLYNAGGIYENAVAQQLKASGFEIYYYNSNRLGELDFVIDYSGSSTPIEVKSGKDYDKHSALNNCLQNTEYEMKEGFVLADCNIHAKGKVTYLPIFMIMFIKNDSEDYYLN